MLQPPFSDEGLAARRDLLRRRRIDHVVVIRGDLVVQALRGMGEQVSVLVDRAALHRHCVPDGGNGLVEPRRAIDDEELGAPQPALDEKLLAAHRAGVKNIVLPKDNEKDLADIPKNVLDTLNVYLVQTMDEVLKIALTEPLTGRLSPDAQAEPVDSAIIDDTITH